MINGLKKFKKLNKLILHLKNNDCNDECVDFFLDDFKKVKKLEKLDFDLSTNQIRNKGAIRMLDIMKFSIQNLSVNLEYN